jgi:hypothetical protein
MVFFVLEVAGDGLLLGVKRFYVSRVSVVATSLRASRRTISTIVPSSVQLMLVCQSCDTSRTMGFQTELKNVIVLEVDAFHHFPNESFNPTAKLNTGFPTTESTLSAQK